MARFPRVALLWCRWSSLLSSSAWLLLGLFDLGPPCPSAAGSFPVAVVVAQVLLAWSSSLPLVSFPSSS